MLHDLQTLVGSSVIAADGEIGSVRNFLFDDVSWEVRYLVINVGNWLKKWDVIVPITAVEQPDWAKRIFHVSLTREQVRNSPGADAEKPVVRQQEIAMRDYFGRLAYWLDGKMGAAPMPTGVKYPLHTKEDPHLRSAWDQAGSAVWAADTEMGRLEGFIIEQASWHIGYLTVKGGSWLQSRLVLIPTGWVKSVSWPSRRIDLLHAGEEQRSSLRG